MHRFPKLGGLAGIAALALGALAVTAQPANAGATTVTSSYIVQVDASAGPAADVVRRAVAPLGGSVEQVFTKAINGAVVSLPTAAPGRLVGAPGVEHVSPNGTMRVVQANPPWGLDRI